MVEILFDTEQRRMKYDRLPAVAMSIDFDTIHYENTFIEPVHKTLMLRPFCMDADWNTSNSGNYEKLGFSDFSFEDASAFWEAMDQASAGPWITNKNGTSSFWGLTNDFIGTNRGMVISFFFFFLCETFKLVSVGYNDSYNENSGIRIDFHTNGDCEVYKDGIFRGSGTFTGSYSAKSGEGSTETFSCVKVIILPSRRKELLIFSPTHGGGFSVVFDEISEFEENPIIVPNTKFWFKSNAVTGQIQIAPIKFHSSGFATSLDLSFYQAPNSLDVLEEFENEGWIGTQSYKVYGDPAFVGTQTVVMSLRDYDNNIFVPNGSNRECRIRCTLTTSSAGYTPFIYGGQIAYAPVFSFTDGSSTFDAIDYTLRLSFSVGAECNQVISDVTLREPDYLDDSGVIREIRSKENRAIQLKIDDVVLLDARGLVSDYQYSWNDEAGTIDISMQDCWKSLEKYMFVERTPLDGFQFHKAIEFLVKFSGVDTIDIHEVPNLLLNTVPEKDGSGNLSWVIEIGDNPATWIKDLMEQFAADWYYGFMPTETGVKFFAKPPDEIGTFPVITLYSTIDDAKNIGGYSDEDAYKYVYRKFSEVPRELEANDIRVTGFNPRTQQVMQAFYFDDASANPETLVVDQPDNWLGEIRKYGLIEPRLVTQKHVDDAALSIGQRLSRKYYDAEIECEFLRDSNNVPYWRGQIIRLHNHDKEYRIETFGVDIELDDNQITWFPCTYTLSR